MQTRRRRSLLGSGPQEAVPAATRKRMAIREADRWLIGRPIDLNTTWLMPPLHPWRCRFVCPCSAWRKRAVHASYCSGDAVRPVTGLGETQPPGIRRSLYRWAGTAMAAFASTGAGGFTIWRLRGRHTSRDRLDAAGRCGSGPTRRPGGQCLAARRRPLRAPGSGRRLAVSGPRGPRRGGADIVRPAARGRGRVSRPP